MNDVQQAKDLPHPEPTVGKMGASRSGVRVRSSCRKVYATITRGETFSNESTGISQPL